MVSNASWQLFPNNTRSSYTNFLPEQVNLDGQGEVAISENSYPSMYQKVTEENLCFTIRNSPKKEAHYLQPGLCSSITDNVEALKTLKQEINNHRDKCITIQVSRVTQKEKVYLASEESSLALFSTDLRHKIGRDVEKNLGILMCAKGSHEQTFAYDIIRIRSLMTYTDIVEYNIVGGTKAPLFSCFPFYPSLNLVT